MFSFIFSVTTTQHANSASNGFLKSRFAKAYSGRGEMVYRNTAIGKYMVGGLFKDS